MAATTWTGSRPRCGILSAQFNKQYTRILDQLQTAWTTDPSQLRSRFKTQAGFL